MTAVARGTVRAPNAHPAGEGERCMAQVQRSGATRTPWDGTHPASEEAILSRFAAEGLRPYRWSNGPGDRYAVHSHPYHKVIYVVEGSIRFDLRPSGSIELHAGDRLDLPAGVEHSAVVGPEGVVCLEGHRWDERARDGA